MYGAFVSTFQTLKNFSKPMNPDAGPRQRGYHSLITSSSDDLEMAKKGKGDITGRLSFTDNTRILVMGPLTYHKNELVTTMLDINDVQYWHSTSSQVDIKSSDDLVIYNIPALHDVKENFEEMKAEVINYFKNCDTMFHAVFLVFRQPLRWDYEVKEFVQFVKTLFDENILKNNCYIMIADYQEIIVPKFQDYVQQTINEYRNLEVSYTGSLKNFEIGKLFSDVTRERCISVETLKYKHNMDLILEEVAENKPFMVEARQFQAKEKQNNCWENLKKHKWPIIGFVSFIVLIGITLVTLKFTHII